MDVAVIGAGIAGCALAMSLLRLRSSLRIVVIDKSIPGDRRIGETLPPYTHRLLRQLELLEPFEALGPCKAHGTSAAWERPEIYHNAFLFAGQGHGWHVDRGAFDAWMCEMAVQRGTRITTNCHVRKISRTDRGWYLGTDAGELQARYLVDATGRAAAVSRRLGARRVVTDRLVAVYRYFRWPSVLPENLFSDGAFGYGVGPDARTIDGRILDSRTLDSRTLIEAMAHGWWYSTGSPGGDLVIALMTDNDLVHRHKLRNPVIWDRLWRRTRYTRLYTEGAEPLHDPAVAPVGSQRLEPVCDRGWLAVGDAAATFDPLSSLGIFKALRGAILGSYAILDHLTGKPDVVLKYSALIEGEYRSYMSKRAEVYSAVTRFEKQLFWQRRQARV